MDRVVFIQHTHWDLKWWPSGEETLANLVRVMDKVIDSLIKDRAKYFLLDGQTSVIADYLSVRRDRVDIIRRLVGEGKLEVGPWYSQTDTFLVSGESIVRNLLIGMRICRGLGGCLCVGYIPDSFGLCAQLPQILRGFGIDVVLASRGLGDEVERLGVEFKWRSPDGSEVLMIFLPTAYLNAGYLGIDYSHICRLRRYLALPLGNWAYTSEVYYKEPEPSLDKALDKVKHIVDVSRKYSRSRVHFVMNGVDRAPIQLNVLNLVKDLEKQLGISVEVTSLGRAVQEVKSRLRGKQLPVYEGEFRGSRFWPVLTGCAASRIRIKQLNFLAERLLANYLEPLSIIAYTMFRENYKHFIDDLWKKLLKIQFHDSICGTLTDEPYITDRGVLTSIVKFCGALVSHILTRLAVTMDYRPLLIVFNPLPYHVKAPVEVILYPDSRDITEKYSVMGKHFEVVEEDPVLQRYVTVLDLQPTSITMIPLTRINEDKLKQEQLYKVKVDNDIVVLENEHLVVEVNLREGGIVKLVDKETNAIYGPMLLFLDEDDNGDLYTFDGGRTRRTSKDARARLCKVYNGELIKWIKYIVPFKGVNGRQIDVEVQLRIYAGVKRLDAYISVVTRGENHRLSILFTVPFKSRNIAFTPFLAVDRPIEPPYSPNFIERADTWNFQEWIALENNGKGIVVAARGLYDYKLREGNNSTILQLTLLRSIDRLSKDNLTTRKCSAGPSFKTTESKEIGYYRYEVSIIPITKSLEDAANIAKTFLYPPIALIADGIREQGKQTSKTISLIKVQKPIELSTIKFTEKSCNDLVIRLYNPWRRETKTIVEFKDLEAIKICEAKLNEEVIECKLFSKKVELEFKPGEIKTIILREAKLKTLLI